MRAAALRGRRGAGPAPTPPVPPPPQDEPTSGLDARAAGVVLDAVRATVDTGRTVVCTIHQPSLDIFEVGGGG